jgi:hypothetical protein
MTTSKEAKTGLAVRRKEDHPVWSRLNEGIQMRTKYGYHEHGWNGRERSGRGGPKETKVMSGTAKRNSPRLRHTSPPPPLQLEREDSVQLDHWMFRRRVAPNCRLFMEASDRSQAFTVPRCICAREPLSTI